MAKTKQTLTERGIVLEKALEWYAKHVTDGGKRARAALEVKLMSVEEDEQNTALQRNNTELVLRNRELEQELRTAKQHAILLARELRFKGKAILHIIKG